MCGKRDRLGGSAPDLTLPGAPTPIAARIPTAPALGAVAPVQGPEWYPG